MKEINKLVDLVTHGLKSNFGVIDLTGQIQDPGKEQQLYNGVLSNNYPNDEVTAKSMYNANVNDQRFRMLKSRLRYKLYDLLYYIDFETPHHSISVQKKLECKSYLHKAHILFELGDLEMTEKQYNKALVLASEFQFTSELIEANELKRKVLSKEFKPTDFELTINELKALRKLEQLEKEAEDQFIRMEMLLSKSIHSRNISRKEAEQVVLKLEELFNETNSYEIFEYHYRLNIWTFLINADFRGLIDFLVKTQKEVTMMKIASGRFDVANSHFIQSKCLLSISDHNHGIEEAKKAIKLVDKSTDMWFKISEVEFLHYMHQKDYKSAHALLTSVLKNPNFNRASLEIINRWKIFKIFLNFALPELGIQKRIRFHDIYEASEDYFNELKGYKIGIYLLEFIHLLNKDSLDLADKKMDELESYFYKHLNDPGKNQREKQLLKMVKILRGSGYNVAETNSKAVVYAEKMSDKKTVNAFSDFEILPYEDLWPLLLDAVSKKSKVTG
ncbi:MAG: hypothetical protein JXR07_07640 [Reichenbachiella sp.]